MISFGHTSVGAIAGAATYNLIGHGNLEIGLLVSGAVGVGLHYVVDFIPHGHFFKIGDFRKKIAHVIIFDLLFSIILFLGISFWKMGLGPKWFYILFCIGGSQLPDALDGFIYAKIIKPQGLLKWEFNFHQALHWHGKGEKALVLGWIDLWQLLVVLIALYLIIH